MSSRQSKSIFTGVLLAVGVTMAALAGVSLLSSVSSEMRSDAAKTQVFTSEERIALMDNYYANIDKTQYSSTRVERLTLESVSSGKIEVGTLNLKTGAINTRSYKVDKGENELVFKTPLEVSINETLVLGGGESTVDLLKQHSDEEQENFGAYVELEKEALPSTVVLSEDKVAVELTLDFPENDPAQVFPNVRADAAEADIFDNGTLISTTNCYSTFSFLAGKTIKKIGFPVASVKNYKEDCKIPIVIGRVSGQTVTSVLYLHELVIPAYTFRSNEVNQWYYFDDLEIEIADDCAPFFHFFADPEVDFYIDTTNKESEYNYYIFHNTDYSLELNQGQMYLDIWTNSRETEYTFEMHLADLKSESEAAA